MKTSKRYSSEIRERAVRMVFEHAGDHDSQWAAIQSIAGKLGCTTESLRRWVRQAERDTGKRAGLTTDERERLKVLERENQELRRRLANAREHMSAVSTRLVFLEDRNDKAG